jgi:uncharacterized protein YdhG (YjbR/CyaY superfamily)
MTVDGYISRFQPKVQRILRKIRTTVRSAAPKAEEVISYRMPALRQNGILIWYAAFTNHIGLYPPIRGDAKLVGQAARYAGEKGNLRFPLDEAIPYRLIAGLTKLRARQAEVSPPATQAPPQPDALHGSQGVALARAKLPETREKRLAQMLDELAGGTRYMKMRWKMRR